LISKDIKSAKNILGLKSLREKRIKKIDLERINFKSKIHKGIFWLIFETGIKVGELVNIKTKDIDFENNVLFIDNEKAPRAVNISEELKSLLKEIANQNKEYLFYSRQSPKLSPRRVQQIFKIYSKESSEVKPQELRDIAIARLAKEYSIDEIKELSGLKHFSIYTHGNIGFALDKNKET